MHDKLQIEIDHSANPAVVRLIGSCTMEVAEQVQERLDELVSGTQAEILIDLSRLNFIESSGLAAIISAYVRCKRRNCELKLFSPTPPIQRLLSITRLSDLMPVFENHAAAVRKASH